MAKKNIEEEKGAARGPMDLEWLGRAFAKACRDAPVGDVLKTARLDNGDDQSMVLVMGSGAYYKITADGVVYKPSWQARKAEATTIMRRPR